jgi:hypothetical protein
MSHIAKERYYYIHYDESVSSTEWGVDYTLVISSTVE